MRRPDVAYWNLADIAARLSALRGKADIADQGRYVG
jgi:hypothetical protein